MYNRLRSMSFSCTAMDSAGPNISVELLPLELREVYQSWRRSSATPDNYSHTVVECDWPVSIYVPERYEEGYAYPLVTWFHSDANDEDQLEDVMNALSPQNYVGLALRGNRSLEKTGGMRWDVSSFEKSSVNVSELLHLTTCRLRRAFHVHSERIFLAGCGHGADAALHLLCKHPEWFAGAMLLDPFCEVGTLPGNGLVGLESKPILLSHARNSALDVLARCVASVRSLRNAGATVDVRMTDLPVDPLSNEIRSLDYWMMDCIKRQ
jgi:phospholipase/carboxylesterase